jgi:hypothetical protein
MFFMTGVSLRNGNAMVALDPGQSGVSYPVGADLLNCDPREMAAKTLP